MSSQLRTDGISTLRPSGTGNGRLPSLATYGLSRIGVEVKSFFRGREAMMFTFLFPVMILVLFGAIFSGTVGNTGVSFKQVFTAGIIAAGVMTVGFSTLAIQIAVERDDGTLRRLAGTPMPKAAYFIGKLGMVLVVSVIQTALMLAIGALFYGLHLPDTGAKWLTLGWVLLLGLIACSLIGIAYSRLAKNGKTASAVVTPPYMILQFISGVYFVFSDLPKWLQNVAALFPLKWMAQGLRSVFLPASFVAVEPAHSWEHGRTAIILVAWSIAGFLLSLLFFRWQRRGET